MGKKRQLAQREHGLGMESLTAFVEHAPLWKVHQSVFAVLALESEPVDPRLACEVARPAAARFADGVWLVELSAVRDPALVPTTVAAVLGVPLPPGSPPGEALAAALSRRQLLLVLDNYEHVLDAAAELCGLVLPTADDVTVLATSREPLGIAGETRYRLGPLPLPGSGPARDRLAPPCSCSPSGPGRQTRPSKWTARRSRLCTRW